MQDIKTLKQQVETVLREFPEARNSDITLMIELWKKYYSELMIHNGLGDFSIELKELYQLPREDLIGRARRLIQSDKSRIIELRYLPTDPEVLRQRKINEEEWREAMKPKIDCSGGRCFFSGSLPDVCPNVRSGYHLHTEVKCQMCGESSMWGMSWDQDKEKEFICSKCKTN